MLVCVYLCLLALFVCLSRCIIDAHGKPRAMRLCFLKARARATDGLCMMTDAKHRVRSTRGARGSNPSQKTPRQRGEFIPSHTQARFSTCLSRCIIDAHGKPRAMRLCFLMAHARATDGLCMMTDAKHRARSARGARGSNPSQKTPRQRSARSALSTRVARSLLFKSARLCLAQADSQRGRVSLILQWHALVRQHKFLFFINSFLYEDDHKVAGIAARRVSTLLLFAL